MQSYLRGSLFDIVSFSTNDVALLFPISIWLGLLKKYKCFVVPADPIQNHLIPQNKFIT